jgi:hypothetical protein
MIQIEQKYDLLALHRTIMEAKFHDPPSNEDVLASPIIARLANDVLDEMIDIETREERGPHDEGWRHWRDVTSRPDIVRIVMACARQSPHWNKQSRDEKIEYIRCGLSPIHAPPETLERLVDEVDRNREP